MMKLIRIAGDSLRMALSDLLRRPLGTLLSMAAMTVAVALLAAFLVVMQGASRTLARWTDQAVAEVYLEEDASEEAVGALVRRLSTLEPVSRVERVTAERALREFRGLFPEIEDIEQLLGENPLPASLRITLADPEGRGIEEIERAASGAEGVAGIRFDLEWIADLSRTGQALGWLLLGGSALLLGAALVTVGSVVRLALDDKRDEVRLMRLIGAPVSFVIAPILVSGGLLGGFGGALAVLGVEFARKGLVDATAAGPLAGWIGLLLGSPLGIASEATLLGLAVAAGTLAAALAAGREAVR